MTNTEERFSRNEMLFGKEPLLKLKAAHVAVFGVGGVGGYVCETLARSGVGNIDIIDRDTVSLSNINRQIIALSSTVDKDKVEVMAQRMRDINPEINVTPIKCFYLPETRDRFDFSKYDYVADAVDTVAAKLDIILAAKEAKVPVISAMGAGNKLDPTAFRVADIYDTQICPLARVMRKELKKRGVDSLKVVYSTEPPVEIKRIVEENGSGTGKTAAETDSGDTAAETVFSESGERREEMPAAGKKKSWSKVTPGSTVFTPSVMGIIIGSEIVKDIIGQQI